MFSSDEFDEIELSYIKYGLDITNFTIQSSTDGLGNSILDFTYDQKNDTGNYIEGLPIYAIPDQVKEFIPISSTEIPSPTVNIFTTKENVVKWINLQVVATEDHEDESTEILTQLGSHVSFLSEESRSFKETILNGKIVIQISYQREMFKIKLQDSKVLAQNLNQDFIEFLTNDELLPSEYNPETSDQYENFLQEFGTHFFDSVTFGGNFMITIELDQCHEQNLDEITPKILETVESYFEIEGRYSVSLSDTVLQALPEIQTKLTMTYLGGDMNLADPDLNLLRTWFISVPTSRGVIKCTTRPTYELLDGKKAENIKKATRTFILKQYLRYLKDLDEVGQFSDEIVSLLDEFEPKLEEIIELGKKIDV